MKTEQIHDMIYKRIRNLGLRDSIYGQICLVMLKNTTKDLVDFIAMWSILIHQQRVLMSYDKQV
jgi:hypothetical protein